MITFKQEGDFSIITRWLHRMSTSEFLNRLDSFGLDGVAALSKATPKDTGLTSTSWGYRVIKPLFGKAKIEWFNDNVNDGRPIAILIQYGHGTGMGVYVEGVDYVNPAMEPVFNKIAKHIWDEVTKK